MLWKRHTNCIISIDDTWWDKAGAKNWKLSKGNLHRLVINKSFYQYARQTMQKANIDKHSIYEYSLMLNKAKKWRATRTKLKINNEKATIKALQMRPVRDGKASEI